jgi:hypothetical protein
MTSSVCWSALRCCWNSPPTIGSLEAQGMLASLLVLRFSSRPPMTTTWPLRARTMESDWRVVDSASGRLKTLSAPPSWMLLFWSCTRLTVGRTCRVTWSFSSICGVIVITMPTGTVCGVVVKVVVVPTFAVVVVSALTLKYTRLSTTLSSAVWLFSAISLGLDSTLVSPNDSSRSIAAVKPLLPVLV